MRTKVNWINKFHLEGETETGHTLHMDFVPPGNESQGPAPRELLLQSLAGCTMMTVTSLLERAGKKFEKFWIDADGELAREHPQVFTKINLVYNLIGDNLDDKTVGNAIRVSKEKLCPVIAMISKACEINCSYNIYTAVEFINRVLEENYKN